MYEVVEFGSGKFGVRKTGTKEYLSACSGYSFKKEEYVALHCQFELESTAREAAVNRDVSVKRVVSP